VSFCSDGLDWVKLNVKSHASAIVLSDNKRGEGDLAILTLCDDIIMTVGSFGWWAGWLAGGTTIYWKDYPKPHSDLAVHFNTVDYYPKNWIGMRS
jgi:galactoside 2-L-fucosyltransferase 1/2